MTELTNIQKYAIDSLFEKKQMNKERLLKALKVLPDSLLITFIESLFSDTNSNEIKSEENITSNIFKEGTLRIYLKSYKNKMDTIKLVHKVYKVSLIHAKDIVDSIPTFLPGINCINYNPLIYRFIIERFEEIGCEIESRIE